MAATAQVQLLVWAAYDSGNASLLQAARSHRLVVRTSRCGRDNPSSNPGEDRRALSSSAPGAKVAKWASRRRRRLPDHGSIPGARAAVHENCGGATGFRSLQRSSPWVATIRSASGQSRRRTLPRNAKAVPRLRFSLPSGDRSQELAHAHGPHRLVVRTSRCGRDNPGSNPGEDTWTQTVDDTKEQY